MLKEDDNMDRGSYDALAHTAMNCFLDHQSGLKAYIEAEKDGKRTAITKKRMREYKIHRKFCVSGIESSFHLIGFLDAIAWMARNDYIDFERVEQESAASVELEDDAEDWERELMEAVITDADMIDDFCFDVITGRLELLEDELVVGNLSQLQ